MITGPTPPAYPSPNSAQMLMDFREQLDLRLRMAQDAASSMEEKVQKVLDPEVTRMFNIEFKTVIDLYA